MKTIQSIDRVAMILDYVAQNPNCRLIDISTALDIKNTTLHALISTLEHWSFINKTEDNKYLLGHKLYELGKIYESRLTLKQLCEPYMNLLVQKYSETCHLAILTNNKVQYIHKVESSHSLRLTSKVGCTDELYATASGKAILANLEQAVIDKFLSHTQLEPKTEYTIITAKALKKDLENIKTEGYALDLQEYEIGLNCIAAPIFDIQNRPVASISLSMPTNRYARIATDSMKKKLVDICTTISTKHSGVI